jgi:hypothetical protein
VRERVDDARIRELARALGRVAQSPGRLYLTGGSTAVVEGWRSSTIDVDLRFEPESDELLRALPGLEELYRYPAIEPAAFRRKLSAALE